ncbi:LOW QUALITY PROTEIN: protein OS-9 [Excalfactoria chinensis]|uniref:LOW QUALITY PROTEIN: protein OS-9 n=1 Tax=Excalfactoria chinensis TaxID=46218 RepID=UPI003B3A8C55
MAAALRLALALLAALRAGNAALNLRELSEMVYGLEISREPVLAGQHQAADVVTVSSVFQQRYECRLPPAALSAPPAPPPEARPYNGSGVAELLRPMATAPCLLKTKDWWTYRFCYGKHIQQYHVEDSEIKGDILFLGHFQSAFDWDDAAAQASTQHRLKRYHSQTYGNGSRCDLTGSPREAEVRFVCEEGAADHIARVDEPQSCSYVLTVHTARLCHHPWLRPPPSAAPLHIRCQPALSPQQYVHYVRAQVSDTKRKVEEISEELRTLDSRIWSNRDGHGPPPAPPQAPHSDTGAVPTAAPEPDAQRDGADSAPGTASSARTAGGSSMQPRPHGVPWRLGSPSPRTPSPPHPPSVPPHPTPLSPRPHRRRPKKIHFKVIRSPRELLQFLEELKESARKAQEKGGEQRVEKDPETPDPKEAPSPEPPSSDPPGPEEEEEVEEEEEEDAELLGGFEKELGGVLLPREQMAQLKEEVKTEMEKEFDNIINEVEDELEAEGLKGDFDRRRASSSLAATLRRLMERLDGAAPPSPPPTAKDPEEGESAGGSGLNPTPPAPQTPVGGGRVQEVARGPPRLQQLEGEVKELLAKEGLRAEGKIRITIVTAGGDAGGDDVQWLSDEDTKNLKDIFLNVLLQGSEEAQKERRRLQALEDNYRFVWGGRNESPPPPPSHGDSDDHEL